MLEIKQVSIQEAYDFSLRIPEFKEPVSVAEYERRFKGMPHLILMAYVDGAAAGFKVGYERDGYFYSWLGGVLPAYRRQKVALALAEAQEKWAKKQAYDTVTFKTRNQHKNMLIFALKRGFNIIGFTAKEEVLTNRILLRKHL